MGKKGKRSLQEMIESVRERIDNFNRLAQGRSYYGNMPGYYDDVDEVYYLGILLINDISDLDDELVGRKIID